MTLFGSAPAGTVTTIISACELTGIAHGGNIRQGTGRVIAICGYESNDSTPQAISLSSAYPKSQYSGLGRVRRNIPADSTLGTKKLAKQTASGNP